MRYVWAWYINILPFLVSIATNIRKLSAAGTHSIVNTKKFMGGLCISIMFLLYCIRHFITGLFREDEKRFAVSETDPQDSARR